MNWRVWLVLVACVGSVVTAAEAQASFEDVPITIHAADHTLLPDAQVNHWFYDSSKKDPQNPGALGVQAFAYASTDGKGQILAHVDKQSPITVQVIYHQEAITYKKTTIPAPPRPGPIVYRLTVKGRIPATDGRRDVLLEPETGAPSSGGTTRVSFTVRDRENHDLPHVKLTLTTNGKPGPDCPSTNDNGHARVAIQGPAVVEVMAEKRRFRSYPFTIRVPGSGAVGFTVILRKE